MVERRFWDGGIPLPNDKSGYRADMFFCEVSRLPSDLPPTEALSFLCFGKKREPISVRFSSVMPGNENISDLAARSPSWYVLADKEISQKTMRSLMLVREFLVHVILLVTIN